MRHTAILARNFSLSKLEVPTHEGDRAQCAAHIVYGVYSTVLSQHYHAENASISLVKMGKQEYVLMPRHGEACDRQQSQCSDYVLMTSNKQITVFEFLMFMRLNNRFTLSGAVQINNIGILMEILDHWYLPVSYAD